MDKLLPCPFCGGEAEFEQMGDRRQSCIVACTDCGCRHESSDENENNGQSWNTRHAPDSPEQWALTPCPDGGKCYKKGETCGDPICVDWHADLLDAAPKWGGE